MHWSGIWAPRGPGRCLNKRPSGAYSGGNNCVTWMRSFEQVTIEARGEVMNDIVTEGILVVGDEMLSGGTKDKNIGVMAEYLANIGMDPKESEVGGAWEGEDRAAG